MSGNETQWDEAGTRPLDYAGEAARNLFIVFGCVVAVACVAAVDPAGIAATVIGDDAPTVVKLCATMMGGCLGIIYWQQKEIVSQAKQSRADFRDMIRTVNRLMDDREEIRHRAQMAYIDQDVAEQLDRREQRRKEAEA